MKNLNTITTLGLFLIIVFALIQILKFYGVGVDIFGSYLFFYLFLLICIYLLANN